VDCPDLTGRVVIVTGSNVSVLSPVLSLTTLLIPTVHHRSGLGYEAAKTLSKFNPSRLILAVRNTGLGEKAAQEIVEANAGKGTVPEVWTLDLGRLQSVKDFAERVDKELERLDIVVSFSLVISSSRAIGWFRAFQISNAGIATEKFVRTVDGFESTYVQAFPNESSSNTTL
jgi:NAD(P)-dependent dehydrogenase (short-subunit alcohol dehydrogenase family)